MLGAWKHLLQMVHSIMHECSRIVCAKEHTQLCRLIKNNIPKKGVWKYSFSVNYLEEELETKLRNSVGFYGDSLS